MVQQALLKLFERASEFDPELDALSWALGIAAYEVRTARKWRLRRREDFSVICPGHGPVVWEAKAKLQEYLEHRAERERALLLALDDGRRSVRELLDAAWPEVPLPLRGAARATLAAHLDKLGSEGRLPAGVERPAGGAGA